MQLLGYTVTQSVNNSGVQNKWTDIYIGEAIKCNLRAALKLNIGYVKPKKRR